MAAKAANGLVDATAHASLWLQPHRIGLIAIAAAMVVSAAVFMRWDWLPNYYDLALAASGARSGFSSLRRRSASCWQFRSAWPR